MESQDLAKQAPLPVSQKPEAIGFGVVTAVLGSAFVARCVELAASGDGSPENIVTSVGAVAAGTVFMGVQAERAYDETRAYEQATEEERHTEQALERQRDVQVSRTVMWGSGVACSSLFGLKAIHAMAETGNTDNETALCIGIVLAAGAGLVKSVTGFLESHDTLQKIRQKLQKDPESN